MSNISVITCVPDASATGTLTLVQFCQPPVAGTLTLDQTELEPLKPRCSCAPLGEATRISAVYPPELETLTL